MGDGASDAHDSLDSGGLSFHERDNRGFGCPDLRVVGYPDDLGCMPWPEIAGQWFPAVIRDPVPDQDDSRNSTLVCKPAELPSNSHAVVRRVGDDQRNRETSGDCTPKMLQSSWRVEDHDISREVTCVSQNSREESILWAEATRPRVFNSTEDEQAYPFARRITESVDDIGRIGIENDESSPPWYSPNLLRDVVFLLG